MGHKMWRKWPTGTHKTTGTVAAAGSVSVRTQAMCTTDESMDPMRYRTCVYIYACTHTASCCYIKLYFVAFWCGKHRIQNTEYRHRSCFFFFLVDVARSVPVLFLAIRDVPYFLFSFFFFLFLSFCFDELMDSFSFLFASCFHIFLSFVQTRPFTHALSPFFACTTILVFFACFIYLHRLTA